MEEDVVIANLDADKYKDIGEKWVPLFVTLTSSLEYYKDYF